MLGRTGAIGKGQRRGWTQRLEDGESRLGHRERFALTTGRGEHASEPGEQLALPGRLAGRASELDGGVEHGDRLGQLVEELVLDGQPLPQVDPLGGREPPAEALGVDQVVGCLAVRTHAGGPLGGDRRVHEDGVAVARLDGVMSQPRRVDPAVRWGAQRAQYPSVQARRRTGAMASRTASRASSWRKTTASPSLRRTP